jgi:hypothetical protein
LEEGEKAEYSFILWPHTMENIRIVLPGENTSVYMGALFIGGNNFNVEGADDTAEDTKETVPEETARPGFFTLNIPLGQYRYVRIDTEDGLTGEAIVRGTAVEDGEVRIVTLQPRQLPGRDEKPVEVKRRKFYGAYGRFWIALPLAFFINGVSQAYFNSHISTGSPALYDKYQRSYYVSVGVWAVAGVFLVESLIRMGIYVHTASEEAIPLWE